ncbi:MAG TPA: IS701 family transposase [Lacunisphaera sp.]|nr:IS701 family transposase [Lacunisphaera sp.]
MAAGDQHDSLRGVARRFVQFMDGYAPFFRTKTRDGFAVAQQYLHGLVQADRSNMSRMQERVPDSCAQQFQHFLSNSPWSERAVLDQVARDADKLLGGNEDSALLIDETSFIKKGDKSVGVGIQYCGRLGNTANCQVGVVGALVSQKKAVPIDCRLFLPRDWSGNEERCVAAGIPQEHIVHKTKTQLAYDIVKTAKENGVRFGWVGMDAGYAIDPSLFGDLMDLGVNFVIDLHKNQRVCTAEPEYKRHRPRCITVQVLGMLHQDKDWIRYSPASGTKGPLNFEYVTFDGWILTSNKQKGEMRKVKILIRRSVTDKSDIRYSVVHVNGDVSLEKMARMASARYWIERVFEDAKGCLGLTEYQLRRWRGWHHHMALSCMAHLFLLREKIHNAEEFPLLSVQDVVVLLAHYLPKRDASEDEIFRQLKARHRLRKHDIDRHRQH